MSDIHVQALTEHKYEVGEQVHHIELPTEYLYRPSDRAFIWNSNIKVCDIDMSTPIENKG